jgi:predicted nucleic acid-binding protein
VKAYLDTNVLIAASVEAHPHHSSSFRVIEKAAGGRIDACISTHALAGFYSVLTRAPFSPRVHPGEAGRFLEDNILPHFELFR